jgi:HPt (histidine-containing phosphotransfer) domain-containing protein
VEEGFAALSEILTVDPHAKIIVITGRGEKEHAFKAVAGGAYDFLSKPVEIDELKVVLRRASYLAGLEREHNEMIEGNQPEAAHSLLDPTEPVVSVEVLSQLRKVMPEPAVRQIYSAVVTDLSRRIEALGVAIAKGDAAEIRRIGHAIKGGCGMAGALQAARLGALLEATPLNFKDNQLDNSADLLSDLRAAAQGLERMLDAELPA